MGDTDRGPLDDTPVTDIIAERQDNRLGAVSSSLYAFWSARHSTLTGAVNRRDAYSVLLFNQRVICPVANDFVSSPDDLLNEVLRYEPRGGTDINRALAFAQACVEEHWNLERQATCTHPVKNILD